MKKMTINFGPWKKLEFYVYAKDVKYIPDYYLNSQTSYYAPIKTVGKKRHKTIICNLFCLFDNILIKRLY